MIGGLRVRFFQSHKDSELNLHEGVNVIVGDSTVGKTALFRAMTWLAENRPSGLRFRSDFADKKENTFVEVTTSEGTVVSIEKDADSNATYTVERNGVTERFEKMNKEVPDLVRQALNLSELNMQEQLDQHFLITSTAGEVARVMNKVVRIEEVDEWVQSLTTEINKENDLLASQKKSLEVIDKKLEKFESLDRYERAVAGAEKLQSLYNVLDSQCVGITSIRDKLMGLNLEMERVLALRHMLGRGLADATDLMGKASLLDGEDKLIGGYLVCRREERVFRGYAAGVGPLVTEAGCLERTLEGMDMEALLLEKIAGCSEAVAAENEFIGFAGPLLLEARRSHSLLRELDTLEAVASAMVQEKSAIGERDRLKNEYAMMLRDLGRCPVCYAEVSDMDVERIIGGL